MFVLSAFARYYNVLSCFIITYLLHYLTINSHASLDNRSPVYSLVILMITLIFPRYAAYFTSLYKDD